MLEAAQDRLADEGREAYAARIEEQRAAMIEAMDRRWRADFAVPG